MVALSYTRSEMRGSIQRIIRDKGNDVFTDANINTIIDDAVADMTLRIEALRKISRIDVGQTPPYSYENDVMMCPVYPCYREMEEDGSWTCMNDHTGCIWNDGHNTCNHDGSSLSPLEEEDQ